MVRRWITLTVAVAVLVPRSVSGQCLPAETQRLTAIQLGLDGRFGSAVAASGDRLIVGAPGSTKHFNYRGHAFIYRLETGLVGTYWVLEGELVPADGAWGAEFGRSVALEGDFAVVGAPRDWSLKPYGGAVYIFCRTDSGTVGNLNDDAWVQCAKLLPPDEAAVVDFGASVGISGHRIIVGSPSDTTVEHAAGAAHIFRRDDLQTPNVTDDDVWIHEHRLIVGEVGRYAYLGQSVAILGSRVLVGAPYYDDRGTAYSFNLDTAGTVSDLTDDSWVFEAQLSVSLQSYGGAFGRVVHLSEDVAAISAFTGPKRNSGSVFIFRLDDNSVTSEVSWAEVAMVTPSDVDDYDFFGESLDHLNGYLLVGAPGDDDFGENSGAAYLFRLDDNGTPSQTSNDVWSQTQKLTGSATEAFSGFGQAVALTSSSSIVGAAQPVHWESPAEASCYFFAAAPDCNMNGIEAELDLAKEVSFDLNGDGVPDECERDCDESGIADSCEIASGTHSDCNANALLDLCDIANGGSNDVLPPTGDGLPDECQLDCNANGFPDETDIATGTSEDCTVNGIPDECELDCDDNGAADSCDILFGASVDCNGNGRPDECELLSGMVNDDLPQGGDGIPDVCQSDCNQNGLLDDDETRMELTPDCNNDAVPDECQMEVPTLVPVTLNSGAQGDSTREFATNLATDGNGNWLTLWNSSEEFNESGDQNIDVHMARSSNNGISWSESVSLATGSGADGREDYLGALSTDSRGRWIRTWSSRNDLGETIGSDFDILYSWTDDNGVTWSPPSFLNSSAREDIVSDWRARLATDGSGTWIAVWSNSGFPRRAMMSMSTDNGTTWSQEFDLLGRDARTPEIATDGRGHWVIVYTIVGGFGEADSDIAYRVSSDNGESWTVPRPLNRDFASDSIFDDNAFITTDGLGTWVAVWERALPMQFNQGRHIMVARSSGGFFWGQPEPLQPGSLFEQGMAHNVKLTTNTQGTWIATWSSRDDLGDTIGNDSDSFVSVSRDQGQTWTSPRPLNASPELDSFNASATIVTDRRGNWIAAWNSSLDLVQDIHADSDIHVGRFFMPAGSPDCDCNGQRDDLDLGNCPLDDHTCLDCDDNGIMDRCDPDSDGDSVPDTCDDCPTTLGGCQVDANGCRVMLLGTTDTDCNGNGIPDQCDLFRQASQDCNSNSIPDECETDCNGNGVPDACDLVEQTSLNCNGNGIPDECEEDCNDNGIPDDCDLRDGISVDIDEDGLIDDCDLFLPIPTVSQWGLAVLALLLLITAKIRFAMTPHSQSA